MNLLTSRLFLSALAVATLQPFYEEAAAQTKPTPVVSEEQRMLPYAEPGQLVDIGGRHINLLCTGKGEHTVVLMAGLGSWSIAWYKTQPEIAKTTRVCAFDRASFGFSDPAPKPQILPDIVEDLHSALRVAQVMGPYVVVGQSLGGLEARMFAQRWPQEVAGMVLVDSVFAAQTLAAADTPGVDEAESVERMTTRNLGCALLKAHSADASSPVYRECQVPISVLGDAPPAMQQVWPKFFTPDYAAAKLSLYSSLGTHKYDSADHIDLGDKPLVVLSQDMRGAKSAFAQNWSKTWYAHHEASARLSSRGVHRIVEGSGHDIELDRPAAIVDAVREVLKQLH